MKKSDLKILIKKIQNECALEDPTHITYYWNDDGKLVFKIFFDSLIIPEELMVDEENIAKCFSEQNVYEFDDDFVIKELNREKGFIEVIPDDQKFKVINSYKDYNEDSKDAKNESIVHLAGPRISETFARTKGFILREGEQGPDAPVMAGSQAYLIVAFTVYLVNNDNKKQFVNFLNTLGGMAKEVNMPLKLVINVPQSAEQYVGIETYGNLPAIFEKLQIKDWEKKIYILNSDHTNEVVKTADPDKSLFVSFGPDMIASLQKAGITNFKNPADLKNKIDRYKKENCDEIYEQLLNVSKKAYDIALTKSDAIVKAFMKKYLVNENASPEEIANNFKNTKSWDMALKKYDSIKDNDPPTLEWRAMHFVEMYFTMGKDIEALKDTTGWTAEYKKIVKKAFKDFKDNFNRGGLVGVGTITSSLVKDLNSFRDKFFNAKTADATKEDKGIWQNTEMEKGKSSAGVEFVDKDSKNKVKGDLINPLYFLDVFTFFIENHEPRTKIMKTLELDANNITLKPKTGEEKSSEESPKTDEKNDSKTDSKGKK